MLSFIVRNKINFLIHIVGNMIHRSIELLPNKLSHDLLFNSIFAECLSKEQGIKHYSKIVLHYITHYFAKIVLILHFHYFVKIVLPIPLPIPLLFQTFPTRSRGWPFHPLNQPWKRSSAKERHVRHNQSQKLHAVS